MNILMTSYVYPLAERILLSEKLNVYLDNPRTEEEIRAVTNYIERAYSVESAFWIPEYSEEDVLSLETLLSDLCNKLCSIDPYVAKFCNAYEDDRPYEFMARMWLVARYDDQGEIEAVNREREEMRERGEVGFVLFEEEHPILKNSRQLAEYSYLISLLCNTQEDEYNGVSFILDSDPSQFGEDQPNPHLCREFFVFLSCAELDEDSLAEEELRWKFFPIAGQRLKDTAVLLESAFESGISEKLLYVASLLKTVREDIADDRFKLVVLVSIIELLLTHSPDYNRFNVEDSISKQFRLKAGILIYLNDRTRDLGRIKERLRTMYGLRSNVAHGNFAAVSKYVERLSNKEGEEEYFSDLITDLYVYIKAILNELLTDPDLVEFIKQN